MNQIINYETALHAGRCFIAQMHVDLQAGDDRSLKAYLCTLGDHHEHGWMNIALIHLQQPRALKVCTREEWQRLGRHIRANAEPIILLAPSGAAGRPQPDDLTDAFGRIPVNKFGSVIAFNISHTYGHPYPWSLIAPGQIHLAIGGLRDFIGHELGLSLPTTLNRDLSTYEGQLQEALALARVAANALIGELPSIDFPEAIRAGEVTLIAHAVTTGASGRQLDIGHLPALWPDVASLGRSLSRAQKCTHNTLSYIMLDGIEDPFGREQ